MKNLLAAISLAALLATPGPGRAEDITRFAPLKADQLTPAQKQWADMIAAPPRNAKFTGPPYRAYIRNPDLAPRLSDAVGISALEYLAVAAPQRTCDPHHSPAVDRAI
jgi:4-carboxymuconolactone decarboxylase